MGFRKNLFYVVYFSLEGGFWKYKGLIGLIGMGRMIMEVCDVCDNFDIIKVY